MQLLALLLVPAFVGMVASQNGYGQQGNYGGHNGMVDQGTYNQGGSSRGKVRHNYIPGAANGGAMQGGQMTGVNHADQGTLPQRSGSSRQVVPDLAPVAPGPIQGNVQHANVGTAPDPGQGGSSNGQREVPLGAVQTDMLNNVNMVNKGQAPTNTGNNNPNSGEYQYDYYNGGAATNGNGAGAGAGAGVQPQVNHPQPQGGAGGNNQVYNAGGRSQGKGPAYNGQADKVDNAPLGGAAMDEFNQAPSTGAASVGGTVVGVVVAVLVLVGIVAVAAVFLVRQRQSRIALTNEV